jgi:hypothetical protein
MTSYWTKLRYSGAGSAELELKFTERGYWNYRFLPSQIWYFGGRTKFDAMVKASHHAGRSMKDMNWEPLKESGAA